jgi:tRNA 2-thiouridine synthesizing protein A
MSADFDLEIDASGLLCPQPLLRAKKALNSLAKGKILKIIATDPSSIIDFKAFAAISSHHLLKYEELPLRKYCFWLEKGG